MAFTTYLHWPQRGRPFGWYWENADVWIPFLAARYVANGAAPFLYEASPHWVAGPLLPILLTPAVWIVDGLGLTQGYPFPFPRPGGWLAYGPWALALTGLLFFAVRQLGTTVRHSAEVARRPLWQVQAWMGVLVLFPVAVVSGHPEDGLVLACVLLAIDADLREHFTGSALALAAAIAFKQIGILALPLLFAHVPRGRRLRWLLIAAGLPAVLYAVPLLADPEHAGPALLDPATFPSRGHVAPWFAGTEGAFDVAAPFRLAVVAAAVGAGWWFRTRRDPGTMLAVVALLLIVRILLEPVVFPYYWTLPAGVLLHLADIRGRPFWRVVVPSLLLWAMALWHPPPLLWWIVEAGLLGLLAVPAIAVLRVRQRAQAPA